MHIVIAKILQKNELTKKITNILKKNWDYGHYYGCLSSRRVFTFLTNRLNKSTGDVPKMTISQSVKLSGAQSKS